MYWGIDPYYFIFVIPALLFALWAQVRVQSSFRRYQQVQNGRGLTAAQVARQILDDHGLHQVRLERVGGSLTDHYDPRTNVVRLSDTVYHSTSVAAIGIAAHEVGHAVQHAQGYFPIKIRGAIIPLTRLGSTLAWPLALLGIVFGFPLLTEVGIVLFMAVVAFQLVTLPVEFNASARALRTIQTQEILVGEEYRGAKKVLVAAALTYVAALITAIANLLRLLALANRRR